MAKTKYQIGTVETVLRSSIKEHPRNPRHITEDARKKLRGSVKDIGLMDQPIVNRRTGHLVGGHQRVAILDSLERYDAGKRDYELQVSMVELTDEQELQALVLLNNQSVQGHWDIDSLAGIGIEIGFDVLGFGRADIELMFDGIAGVEAIFTDSPEVEENKGALADIKAERSTMKDRKTDQAETGFYVTVVCESADQKEALMKHLGVPKGERYIAPSEIMALSRK